jgi:acyl carrier protein
MQNPKEEIEAILIQMGLTNISFNLPVKNQMDSLDMTALIIAVEDEWHISISDEEQYCLPTLDDLVKLIHAKTEAIDKHIPTINEQIQYMDVLLAAGQRPNMVRAIKENLIAVQIQMQIRDRRVDRPDKYPLINKEVTTGIPMPQRHDDFTVPVDVEPPFQHPSGHSFMEGHEI